MKQISWIEGRQAFFFFEITIEPKMTFNSSLFSSSSGDGFTVVCNYTQLTYSWFGGESFPSPTIKYIIMHGFFYFAFLFIGRISCSQGWSQLLSLCSWEYLELLNLPTPNTGILRLPACPTISYFCGAKDCSRAFAC